MNILNPKHITNCIISATVLAMSIKGLQIGGFCLLMDAHNVVHLTVALTACISGKLVELAV